MQQDFASKASAGVSIHIAAAEHRLASETSSCRPEAANFLFRNSLSHPTFWGYKPRIGIAGATGLEVTRAVEVRLPAVKRVKLFIEDTWRSTPRARLAAQREEKLASSDTSQHAFGKVGCREPHRIIKGQMDDRPTLDKSASHRRHRQRNTAARCDAAGPNGLSAMAGRGDLGSPSVSASYDGYEAGNELMDASRMT